MYKIPLQAKLNSIIHKLWLDLVLHIVLNFLTNMKMVGGQLFRRQSRWFKTKYVFKKRFSMLVAHLRQQELLTLPRLLNNLHGTLDVLTAKNIPKLALQILKVSLVTRGNQWDITQTFILVL